jgi:hypothetical protein
MLRKPETVATGEQLQAILRGESFRERLERYRSPLNVRTPIVDDPKLRARWYGMPPSKINTKRKHKPIVF